PTWSFTDSVAIYQATGPGSPDLIYTWQITGGIIQSGQGSSTITVRWQTPGQGSLTVFASSNGVCTGRVRELEVNVLLPTSLKGLLSTDMHWKLYPNPTREAVAIQISPGDFMSADVHIYDARGKLVHAESNIQLMSNVPTNMRLDCSRWASGVYQVVLTAGKWRHMRKLILQAR
ncbi:MAG: T9SS type A sorting domain-containing protein, partial [Bacteroidota bacterium]